MSRLAFIGVLSTALLLAACSDAVSPARHGVESPRFATAASTGIMLDQMVGELAETEIGRAHV